MLLANICTLGPLLETRTDANGSLDVIAQSFEWIPHGDATARKRARAHVTRGFRREKAEKAKGLKTPITERTTVQRQASWRTNVRQPIHAGTAELAVEAPREDIEENKPSVLGSWRSDPFGSMPIELAPGTHALLDHCASHLVALSLKSTDWFMQSSLASRP